MTPQRRKAVTFAALVPTALIALGYGWEWGYLFPLVGVVGGLVMVAGLWLVVYAVLPGVDGEKGTPLVFVLGWGAVVLATALGAAGAAVVSNELARYDGLVVLPGAEDTSVFGWYPTGKPQPYSEYHAQVVAGEDPTPGMVGITSDSVVPSGTAAGALMTGWLAGGAAAVVYARTRPRARLVGAGSEPPGDEDSGSPRDDGDVSRSEGPQAPGQQRPEGAAGGTVQGDGHDADGPEDSDPATDDPDEPGGRPRPGGA